MNTSQLGTIGETKVIYDIACKGYPIFREISNTSKVDIITIVKKRCIKLQCKYIDTEYDGAVMVPLYSTTSKEKYSSNDFDILAVYIAFIDKVVYLNWEVLSHVTTTITLRYKINDNKQKNSKLIRLVDDYLNFETSLGYVAPIG